MEKQNSSHSPKNKFRAEIYYSVALPYTGSVESYSFNSLNDAISFCEKIGKEVIKNKKFKCNSFNIRIKENKKTYPEFDWIEVYNEKYFRDNQERKRFCISLSKYRLSKGLSQDQLGKMLNMSAQNISRIECGFFSVGIDKVLKIVDVLGGKITIEDK